MSGAERAQPRPAFYALRSGGWRDYVTLLHPPYTLWHLSYVAVGAGVAPHFDTERFLLALAAFALAMGVGAHALDELKGRPLQTRIPEPVLAVLAVASIGGAVALGVQVAVTFNLWLLAFVAAGAFFVIAYNLELAGGRFHGEIWFALAWGAFPALTGFFAVSGQLRPEAALAALYAFAASLAQQRLSFWVRKLRRRVTAVSGELELADETRESLDRNVLQRPAEDGLRLLVIATTALGAALVLFRL